MHAEQRILGELETEQAIRLRAYELFCDRTAAGRAGTAEDDWLAAEAEVCARIGKDGR
jgi:hypothetical protein